MLRLKRAIVACMLAIALSPSVATHAATYYVATNGNNSNAGTSSQPWRTVGYATSKMVAGDTTYVKSGVYNEGLIQFRRSGTQSAPIKLLNAPGHFPTIDCNNKTSGMVLLRNSSGINHPIGWITIEGFEIRDCYNGIKWYSLHNSTIRRNWVHDTGKTAIFGYGGNKIVIDRNRIYDSRGGHGIYANGAYYTITNNLIYKNYGYGIQQNGSSSAAYTSSKFPSVQFADSDNWVIANNTIAYNKSEAGMVAWGSRCDNLLVQRNIFHENAVTESSSASQGIQWASTTCRGIRIQNNFAFASGSGGSRFISNGATVGVHYTQSGNIVNTSNPKFANAPATAPSSPNFALTSGSPASGYGASASSTQLAAPTSLQVAN